MVADNKILTVSYGTFSCTLEGFDDPFTTMKDIAEYFRELVENDRYFGAEPPTPNTEMLTKIAQRRSGNTVSAELKEQTLTLRNARSGAGAAIAAIHPKTENGTATEEDTFDTLSSLETADHLDENIFEETLDTVKVDTLSEGPNVENILEDVEDTPEKINEAAYNPPLIKEQSSLREDDIEAEYNVHTDKVLTDAENSDQKTFEETALEEDNIEGEDIHVGEETKLPITVFENDDEMKDIVDISKLTVGNQPESLDENFQDIHVLENSEPMVTDAHSAEDEKEQTDLPEYEQETQDHVKVEEKSTEDQSVKEVAKNSDTLDTPTDDTLPIDDFATLIEDAPEEEEEEADAISWVSNVSEDHDLEETTETIQETEQAETASITSKLDADEIIFRDLSKEIEPNDAEIDSEDTIKAEEDLTALIPQDQSDLKPSRPIVMVRKVHKPQTSAPETPSDVEEDAKLEPQDEAELIAELNAIEAEAGTSHEKRHDVLTADVNEDKEALDRLFTNTDSRLKDQDATKRKEHITHMRAAVAARKADAEIGASALTETETQATTEDVYRADFASVVKPRRVSKDQQKSKHPSPLLLVSSQRIEEKASDKKEKNVNSKYILTEQSASGKQDTNLEQQKNEDDKVSAFRDFAADMEAKNMDDLLEAAAAFNKATKDSDTFTRPELMRLIAASQESFTREEGLRSFGALLREGRIKKVSRGIFKLSPTSKYNDTAALQSASK